MRAGKLDRRVTIQRYQETGRNAFNEPVLGWSDVITVWAQKVEARGSERFEAQQVNGTAVTTFVIRHRGDLTVEDRLLYEGSVYEIVAPPRELGRRVGSEVDTVARAD